MSAMEWKVKEKNVLQRELKGAEYLINVTEQNQSGNVSGELCIFFLVIIIKMLI